MAYEVESYEAESSEAESYEAESEAESEQLDTSWLDNFKDEEDSYNDFYPAPLTSVALFLLYIKNKELISVDTQTCFLDATGVLTRERLMTLIKYNETHELVRYKLNDILRYNIDLQPEDINAFVNDPMSGQFLTSEKYLEDIHYKASIGMFQDLNALYFIYMAEDSLPTSHTKRITWRQTNQKTLKKNLKIKKKIN